MTLDDRLRAALHARLDTLEVDAFVEPERREPDRERRTRLQLVIATVTVLGLLATWVAIRFDQETEPAVPTNSTDHAPGDPIPLDAIPQGVSAHRIGWQPTFFVRDGREIKVFLTDPQHLPGERTLWWCPNEEVFAAPTHGELFASDGARIAGPSRNGLAWLPSVIDGDALIVSGSWNDTQPLIDPDPSGAGQRPLPPTYTEDEAWNSGPGSFCRDPIVSGPSERFRTRDENQVSEPMRCADVTEYTYRRNASPTPVSGDPRVQPSVGDALADWLSWNETWFGPHVSERPGTDPPVFVVVLDDRVQMEIHVVHEGDGYRVAGYAHCTESYEDLFAVSEKERTYFGPLLTMPVCEPLDPNSRPFSGPPPTNDDPATCRLDADQYEVIPCTPKNEHACMTEPPHLQHQD